MLKIENMNIKNLVHIRNAKDIKICKLRELTGISQPTINKIEKGLCNNIKFLQKYEKAVNDFKPIDNKYIKRKSLYDIKEYKEIFEKEKHHDHKIVMINDVVRWEDHPEKTAFIKESGGLNNVINTMIKKGLTKNSEEWRELYRNMGYSLFGYWEVFYWEWNNPEAENYTPFMLTDTNSRLFCGLQK